MFCPYCGKTNSDYMSVCSSCGAALRADAGHQTNQPNQQESYNQQQSYNQQPNYSVSTAQQYPMKWYKFLIYFTLIVSALSNFVTGIDCIVGGLTKDREILFQSNYVLWPDMKTLNTIMGSAYIAIAILALVTRWRLCAYRRNSVYFVMALYIVIAIVNLVYIIATMHIKNTSFESLDGSLYVVQVVSSIVIALCNKVYFDKRKELFCN